MAGACLRCMLQFSITPPVDPERVTITQMLLALGFRIKPMLQCPQCGGPLFIVHQPGVYDPSG